MSLGPIQRWRIWGLGPVGWCSAIVLVSLGAAVLAGVDVQYLILRSIQGVAGDSVLWWFVTAWMPFAWFQLGEPSFGLLPLAYILVALHQCPRPVSRLVVAGFFLWALATPIIHVQSSKVVGPLVSDSDVRWVLIHVVDAVIELAIAAALFGFVLRRGAPLAMLIGSMVIARALWILLGYQLLVVSPLNGHIFIQRVSVVLYHAGVGGGLLWWCIRARREHRRSLLDACQACGYSLMGLRSDLRSTTCPECGRPPTPAGTSRA
jgi:hypothetical protein